MSNAVIVDGIKVNSDALRHSAILLVFLESEVPGVTHQIFSQIGEERSKSLIKTIAGLGRISPEEIGETLGLFYDLAIENKVVFGGRHFSEQILKDAFGVMTHDDFFVDKAGLFEFIDQLSDEDLSNYLVSESMQCCALIMTYMSDARVAKVMSMLPEDRVRSISAKMLKVDIPSPQLLWKFQFRLEENLLHKETDVSGIAIDSQFKLARVLEMMVTDLRDRILEALAQDDSEGVERLKSFIFTFEDFEAIDDKDLQFILYELPSLKSLAIALKGQSDSLVAKFRQNMSERSQLILEEELAVVPEGVSDKDVQAAQQDIIGHARTLEAAGKVKPLSKITMDGESSSEESVDPLIEGEL